MFDLRQRCAGASVFLALLLVVGLLSSALHHVAVRHEVCAEHGRVEHSVPAHTGESGEAKGEDEHEDEGDDEGHEACLASLSATAAVEAPGLALMGPFAFAALRHAAVPAVPAPAREALLLASPKTSPPRA